MSLGGGGGTNTVQQTIQEIPEQLAPYYDELMGRGTFQSLQPYTPYPYKRLAEFSPFEQQSMAGIGALARTGTPEAMQTAIEGSQYVAYKDPYAEAIRQDPITAAMVNAIPKKNEITTENSSFSSLIARYLMYGNRQP